MRKTVKSLKTVLLNERTGSVLDCSLLRVCKIIQSFTSTLKSNPGFWSKLPTYSLHANCVLHESQRHGCVKGMACAPACLPSTLLFNREGMFAGRMKTTESQALLVFLTLKCHLALWKRVDIIKNSDIYSPDPIFALLHVSESVISVWRNILSAIQAKGNLQIAVGI